MPKPVQGKPEKKEASQQQACIDLPGDSVECWRSSDNIKVVLKKHRDIIFDLKLGAGKKYSVEPRETRFYNKRDKVIVFPGNRVNFADGERLHVFVERNFKGVILLRSNDTVIMTIEPKKWDRTEYDDDPKTKAQPIIVSMGTAAVAPPAAVSKPVIRAEVAARGTSTTVPPPSPTPAAASLEMHALVCVVEGTIKEMPAVVQRYFAGGGGQSGLAEIDPYDIATRNWIWGQVVGGGAYAHDNWKWLRESLDSRTSQGFKLVKATVKRKGNKVRFYFSGYSRYNTVFGPGGFGASHERVMTIFSGAGSKSSAAIAAGKAVLGTFAKSAGASFIFGTATALLEWREDAAKDGYDATAGIVMAAIKAIVTALLVSIFVSMVVAFAMLVLGASVSVLAVGALTVVAGIGIGYFVEVADKKLGQIATGDPGNTDGYAKVVANNFREQARRLQGGWKDLLRIFPNDYSEVPF